MKPFQVRALIACAKNNDREAAEKVAFAPKGPNRKARQRQQAFNRLLNKKMQKANSLGQGVSMTIGKDGVPHVTVSKEGLKEAKEEDVRDAEVARQRLAEVEQDPGALVRGAELEARLRAMEDPTSSPSSYFRGDEEEPSK